MRFEYEENPAPDGQYKRKILVPGVAKYVVENAVEAISKSSGQPMIELTLGVTDSTGESEKVWVYLLHNKPGRIKAFLESAGRGALYNSNGELRDRDLPGLRGECVIKTQYSTDPKYGDKTVVDYFVVHTADTHPAAKIVNRGTPAAVVHDDIPF